MLFGGTFGQLACSAMVHWILHEKHKLAGQEQFQQA
jgi:hypothetical protein